MKTKPSNNDAPDTKVAEASDRAAPTPGPAKPPALFDDESFSYFGNLVALLRTNSAPSGGGDKAQADAGAALSRGVPAEGEVELPADFPQAYLGFCKCVRACVRGNGWMDGAHFCLYVWLCVYMARCLNRQKKWNLPYPLYPPSPTPPPTPHDIHNRGDKRKALDLYNHGQTIRKELGLDGLLDAPYPQYEQLAAHYPMALHSKSKAGEYVLVQRPGVLDVSKVKAAGLTRTDVVKYFAAHLEFLLRNIDPNAKVLMVVDMKDLGFMKLMSGDFLATIRSISDTLGAVYCRKVTRYAIANPPAVSEPSDRTGRDRRRSARMGRWLRPYEKIDRHRP
jgi:hypothetical protein